ncbi:MAG: hypothetical protein IJI44_08240 [Erysipelotrichaceae bacterium]|nr:hypothetical protein [Erysipelotrichaceae bacterium]
MDAKELILNYRELYKEFKAKTYEEAFLKYEEEVREKLKEIDQEIQNSDDPDLATVKQAANFVDAVRAETICNENIKFRFIRKRDLNDYRLSMVFFVFPMLEKSQLQYAMPLAESILRLWKEEKLGDVEIGKYETLLKGFKRSLTEIFMGR